MVSSGSSEHISALAESGGRYSPANPSNIPARSQPINMCRVTDARVPDVASLSPPAVSY